MTKKEKWIKWTNQRLNDCIKIKLGFIKLFRNFPDTMEFNVEGFLKKKGYNLSKTINISGMSFTPFKAKNWGSAISDTDSVLDIDGVHRDLDGVTIYTFLDKRIGYDWEKFDENGVSILPKPEERECVSGCATSTIPFTPKGIFSAKITMDARAIGSWFAWWFVGIKGEFTSNMNRTALLRFKQDTNEEKYQEIDMIERFFDINKPPERITTSVHRGITSILGRKMYNHAYKLPKGVIQFYMSIEFLQKKQSVKIYINGIHVFTGKQWIPDMQLFMIISDSMLKNSLSYAKENLRNSRYFSRVSCIRRDLK